MHINNSKRGSSNKRMSIGKSKRIQALTKMKVPGVRGRPIVLTPCPFCGVEFGSRDFRAHMPYCHRRYIDIGEPIQLERGSRERVMDVVLKFQDR